MFGPNPAGAATAIRSLIFNYLLADLGSISQEALATELATMEIKPDTRLVVQALFKKIAAAAKSAKQPEKGAKSKNGRCRVVLSAGADRRAGFFYADAVANEIVGPRSDFRQQEHGASLARTLRAGHLDWCLGRGE